MDSKKVDVYMSDRKTYRDLIVCTAHDIATAGHVLSASTLDDLVNSLSRYVDDLASAESELQKITGLLPCNFNQLLTKGDEADENA